MNRGFLVAAIHAALILVIWGKYAAEQAYLPRAWARTAPYDPYDLMRGRYVNVGLLVYAPGRTLTTQPYQGRLVSSNGQLALESADCCAEVWAGGNFPEGYARLVSGRAAYFIPEGVPDPSRLEPGEVLWAEVTIPKRGTPRPLRLWKGKDGQLPPGLAATPPQN